MSAEPLVDPFGRRVRDLRISVTDRCNLRCRYCLPEEEQVWLDRSELLSFEEIERVARVFVGRFGVESIRLTGGEPTLRAQLPRLVARLAPLVEDLSLTTNGVSLALLADDLASAGLRRVNVSLDSLRTERFATLTGRDRLAQVLEGIDAAVAAGLSPVKVNCVVMRGLNDDEVVDLAAYGRDRGVTMRFIEFMPLDSGGGWSRGSVVTAEEILSAIGSVHPLEAVGTRQSEPAERYRYLDGAGEVGVVASVTRAFCGSCDRVRLTAEGTLRNCLFSHREADLRDVLRQGGSDEDLAEAIVAEVGRKGPGHAIGRVEFVQPARTMSRIGG